MSQTVKSLPTMQETPFDSWVNKIHWRRARLPTLVFLGFSGGSVGKESTCNVGDLGSIPGLGRSPGEEKGYPFQYSGLENSMDCIVHGVAKSQTQLNNFHFSTLYPSLAKGKLGKAEIPTSYSHLLVMCYFLSLIFHSFPSIKICSLVVFHS